LDGYMTSTQVGEALGYTVQGINKLCRQGLLDFTWFGKARMITSESVATFERVPRGNPRHKEARKANK